MPKKPSYEIIPEDTKLDLNRCLDIKLKEITKFGNGAKLDCERRFIGKDAYVVVLKESEHFSLKLSKNRVLMVNDISAIIKSKVKRYGTGAMISVPRSLIGSKAFIIIYE